jgi:hypothetical protein
LPADRALLPVRVLSRLFRRLFLENLKAAFESGRLAFFGALAELAAAQVFARRLDELRRAEWVVYAKRPFAGPAAALAYLGRYTYRVAISNSRLIDMTGDRVRFRWREIALCQELLAGEAAAPPSNADKPERTRDTTLDLCPSCGGRMEMLGTLPRLRPADPTAWHDSS